MNLDVFRALFTADEWQAIINNVWGGNVFMSFIYDSIYLQKRLCDHDDYAAFMDTLEINSIIDSTRKATLLLQQPPIAS